MLEQLPGGAVLAAGADLISKNAGAAWLAVVESNLGLIDDHDRITFYRHWRLNMTVEPWDSDVELEVQERAREIEAVGGALLNNARTLVGIHFDSAFQNDPAVIAAVFQGLVALHGPVK